MGCANFAHPKLKRIRIRAYFLVGWRFRIRASQTTKAQLRGCANALTLAHMPSLV